MSTFEEMKKVVSQAHLNQQLDNKGDVDENELLLSQKKTYIDYQGILGEVHAARMPEFAP